MIVARLYEADFENSSTCQGLLYEKVLGCNRDGSGYHCSRLHPDPFLRSIAYWIMKDYTLALDTLLERIPKEDDENPGKCFFFFFLLKYISVKGTKQTEQRATAPTAPHFQCSVPRNSNVFIPFSVRLCARRDGEIMQPGGVQFLQLPEDSPSDHPPSLCKPRGDGHHCGSHC